LINDHQTRTGVFGKKRKLIWSEQTIRHPTRPSSAVEDPK